MAKNGNGGNDTLDGGAGNDKLYGGAGDDTYVFDKGNDIISDNSGKNTIIFKGIDASDVYVVYPGSGNDAILHVTGTDDTLTLQNFRYAAYYRNFTLVFDDGSEGHIDMNTATVVIDKEAVAETETIEQTSAEYLSRLYADDMFSGELTADNSVIEEMTNSTVISGESDKLSDMSSIQAMLLAENMSAFSSDSMISDSIRIGDITAESSALDQLLVNSSMQ